MAKLSLMLHLNTDHVTDDGLDWLCNHEREYPIAIYPTEQIDGVFLHVEDLVVLLDPIPEDMPQCVEDVLEFAEDVDATWLRIDDNGQTLPASELTVYRRD